MTTNFQTYTSSLKQEIDSLIVFTTKEQELLDSDINRFDSAKKAGKYSSEQLRKWRDKLVRRDQTLTHLRFVSQYPIDLLNAKIFNKICESVQYENSIRYGKNDESRDQPVLLEVRDGIITDFLIL